MQGLKNLMAAAARSRSVASTKMNAVSSRSHSVFMLHLHGENDEDGTIVDGALNLCDLAGSERLDRSGAANDAQRLKETQSINKSLSCLGDVFTALSNGSTHVPYRNSKLTYLLQDCLSGDGKALMFVNLSPTLESSNESLCSLRFAQRVNQVELGKATKHISYAKK
jgi:kinesin family protein C1